MLLDYFDCLFSLKDLVIIFGYKNTYLFLTIFSDKDFRLNYWLFENFVWVVGLLCVLFCYFSN